jgi:hypothetical protein
MITELLPHWSNCAAAAACAFVCHYYAFNAKCAIGRCVSASLSLGFFILTGFLIGLHYGCLTLP